MRFFKKSSFDNNDDKTILFVCVENAGRSQMAEGFFKKYAPKGFQVQSAGTKPVSQINPIVVEAMREVGIDISHQKSKEISDEMMRSSDPIEYGMYGQKFLSYIILTKDYRMEFTRSKRKIYRRN
jgi:arsenate reductase (thioredoxin)